MKKAQRKRLLAASVILSAMLAGGGFALLYVYLRPVKVFCAFELYDSAIFPFSQ